MKIYDQDKGEMVKLQFPFYVSAFEIWQVLGGREEGGWWFDRGVPREKIKVRNRRQLRRALLDLRNAWHIKQGSLYAYSLADMTGHPDYERERGRGRTSAAGGHDVWLMFSQEKPVAFPLERPRYE